MYRSIILFIFGMFFLPHYAYPQVSHQFIQTAFINDSGGNPNLVVGPNGMIFLVTQSTGLWACNYDGSNFIDIVHIDSSEGCRDVAIDNNGTVFLTNDQTGLWAYSYDGTSFTNTAHLGDPIRYSCAVAVDADSTVFIADGGYLEAYRYDGSSFAYITNIVVTGGVTGYGIPHSMIVGLEGTVFLTTVDFDCGLAAYEFDGTSFTLTAHVFSYANALNVAMGPDGTVFLAASGLGLRAYNYDGNSFVETGYVDTPNGPSVKDVSIGTNGIVYLALGYDGLSSYNYDGFSFTNTAAINEGGYYASVEVGPDSTIFVSHSDGLSAYAYSPVTSATGNFLVTHNNYSLEKNYPNPFNSSTMIKYSLSVRSYIDLSVFDIQGRKLKTLRNGLQNPGVYNVLFDAHGLASGIYVSRLESGQEVKSQKMLLIK